MSRFKPLRGGLSILILVFLALMSWAPVKSSQVGSLNLPQGYRAEVIEKDLSTPVMVAFDDQNRLLIAEAGTSGGEDQVIRVEQNGNRTVLAHGSDFGDQKPLTSIAFHDGKVYMAHGGAISVLEQDGKVFRDIITGLPGNGDYPVGEMLFQGTVMYFTIGTVTNSGVVASDDISKTWLSNDKLAKQHDIPCQDIQITKDLFNKASPYLELGKAQPGAKISGNVKCNGALLRASIDGSHIQVYAWGFRNPYALQSGPDGNFYVLNQGIQNRGARPFDKGSDCLYKVVQGNWYGWPDFDCGSALPKPIIQNPPAAKPPLPIAKIDINSGAFGFAFAPSNDWGNTNDAFVALSTAKKIVRVDTSTGAVSDFISAGFNKPVNPMFGSDGAMYVSDTDKIWRISKINQANPQQTVNQRYGLGPIMSLFQIIVLGLLTLYFGREKNDLARDSKEGIRYGLIAGAATMVFMLLLTQIIFKTRWFAPIQLFNLIWLSQDVITLHLLNLVLGLVVFFSLAAIFGYGFAKILKTRRLVKVMATSVLYGLTLWAIMQYLILPHYSATIIQRSFPLSGFLLIYVFFGLAIGYLFSQEQLKKL